MVQDGPSVSSFFILLTSSAVAASLSFKVCISTLCLWTVFLGTSWHCIRKRRKKDVASEPRDAVLERKLFWLKELIPLSLPASKNLVWPLCTVHQQSPVETAIRDWLEALVSMAPTIHWHIRPPFASTCYKQGPLPLLNLCSLCWQSCTMLHMVQIYSDIHRIV